MQDKDKETSSAPPKEAAPNPALHLLGKAAIKSATKHGDLDLMRLGKEMVRENAPMENPRKFQK